jgi:hypothetical protein
MWQCLRKPLFLPRGPPLKINQMSVPYAIEMESKKRVKMNFDIENIIIDRL